MLQLEVVSRKADRFGWDRMSGVVKDELLTDWAAVLEPFPLDEIKAACRAALEINPKRCPNEFEIKTLIEAERGKRLDRITAQNTPAQRRTGTPHLAETAQFKDPDAEARRKLGEELVGRIVKGSKP